MTVPGAMSRWLRPGRRWLGRVVVTGAVVVTLSGCTGARNALGTKNSGCYVTLPAAVRAVHGAGHLAGVRLEAVTSLRARAPRLYAVATATGIHVQQVCLVAFRGRFHREEVLRPVGAGSGRLAVVVLEYPDSRLLGTVLLVRAPVSFGHTHIGGP